MSVIHKICKLIKMQGASEFLVFVLLFLFTLSFAGEKTPLNNGIGYDGTFYYQVAQNFTTDFWTTGYDQFRIGFKLVK